MSRSSFALMTLLASLAGPLLFAPAARSQELPGTPCPAEAYAAQSVCTPPAAAIHPADQAGLTPFPGYAGEYADADAEAAWTAPTPVVDACEDWRDFVVEHQSSSITNTYDDLFETLDDLASNSIDAVRSEIEEAAISQYNAEGEESAEYEPYTATELADRDPEYDSIEAYESEFSGYGRTDYLRDNFNYRPQGERGFFLTRAASGIGNRMLRSELVAQTMQQGSELWFKAQQQAAAISPQDLEEASEQAWVRIEEYHRLTSPPVPKLPANYVDLQKEVEFRLADDDCGWDCWRSYEPAPAPVKVADQPSASEQREAILALAVSLRNLAGQLEMASVWVANLGGIDVAELESSRSAR